MSPAIWIVVANTRDAAICESRDGISRMLHTIHNEWPGNPALNDMDPVNAGLARRARRDFAGELMRELCRGAYARACSNIVIVADPLMMDELRRIQINAVSRLVIAEIIQDMPDTLVFPAECDGLGEQAPLLEFTS